MTTTGQSSPVDLYLAAIPAALVTTCDAFSADVIMDATVPNWRFSVSGRAAVRAELGRWYADAGAFEELERAPLPDGELVQFTLRWYENGVIHASHQAHVLEARNGQITRLKIWCGGRWPAALLAEMADTSGGATGAVADADDPVSAPA